MHRSLAPVLADPNAASAPPLPWQQREMRPSPAPGLGVCGAGSGWPQLSQRALACEAISHPTRERPLCLQISLISEHGANCSFP